jgi:4-hydroxy-tetrahydrodipicolinate reductase
VTDEGAPLRLAVIGARGRVGQAVVRLAAERGFQVTRAVAREDVGRDLGELGGTKSGVMVEGDVTALASGGFDVAIDFSSADAVPDIAEAVASAGAALVSGTTGLGPEALLALDAASEKVPVLWEPNMSLGVHVLGRLLRQAVVAMGDGFDIEIVETHHGRKADAPSGTAVRLADIAKEARLPMPSALQHGRQGRPGPRGRQEIGVHAVRGGDIVGDHSVHLLGMGERLELVHRATSRDVFAHGALRAAAWLVGKAPRRYSVGELLGDPSR